MVKPHGDQPVQQGGEQWIDMKFGHTDAARQTRAKERRLSSVRYQNEAQTETVATSSSSTATTRSDREEAAKLPQKSKACGNRKCWQISSVFQFIIIVVLIVILYLQTCALFDKPDCIDLISDQTSQDVYRIYSNLPNKTKILLSLASGCNQRKHDRKFGATCSGANLTACPPVESSARWPISFNDLHSGKNQRSEYDRPVTVITSSKSGLRLSSKQLIIKRSLCNILDTRQGCRFKTILSIYSTYEARRQKIEGWGGALTDSAIQNILGLSINATTRLLDDYFGEDGLRYNMIRITIGGSDFSARFYTNDDLNITTNNQVEAHDLNLDGFHLVEEDKLYKIPMLNHIQHKYTNENQTQQVKVIASMWSPPTWMKTNNHFNKGSLKGFASSPNQADMAYFEALAQLKKKFLLAYDDRLVKIWALTVMNEPVMARLPVLNFNTMIFEAQDYAYYLSKHLGPTIRATEKLSHIKLVAHDDNRRFLLKFVDIMLNDTDVRPYIDGIATHGYVDMSYDLVDKLIQRHKTDGAPFWVLPTELCSGHLPFMEKALIGNWARGVHYALDIIHNLQHYGAGWVDWNMALDMEGGPAWLGGKLDSPIIVDKATDTYYRSPMFYSIGHFSRYIPEGSIFIKSNIVNNFYDYPFETASFLLPNKNTFATVILNNNPYPVELNLQFATSPEAEPKDFLELHQLTVEADSITTVIGSLFPTSH